MRENILTNNRFVNLYPRRVTVVREDYGQASTDLLAAMHNKPVWWWRVSSSAVLSDLEDGEIFRAEYNANYNTPYETLRGKTYNNHLSPAVEPKIPAEAITDLTMPDILPAFPTATNFALRQSAPDTFTDAFLCCIRKVVNPDKSINYILMPLGNSAEFIEQEIHVLNDMWERVWQNDELAVDTTEPPLVF